jgi:hypothetical protein
VQQGRLNATVSRVQHFSSLTGGDRCAILFLLTRNSSTTNASVAPAEVQTSSYAEGIQAYTTLMHTLHFDAASTNSCGGAVVPILLVPSPAALPSLFSSFVETFKKSLGAPLTASLPSGTPRGGFDMLPFCTNTPPLSMEETVALSDAFADLKDVAQGALAQLEQSDTVDDGSVGQDPRDSRLDDALGNHRAPNVCSFFAEEWVAE